MSANISWVVLQRITMDKEQNPNDILSGYMFWRLPNFEAMRNPEQFAKSIRFALNKYKSLYPNFFADSSNNVIYPYEDITKKFLFSFFLHSVNEPVDCFISNISNSENDTSRFFCIRIPSHPVFHLLPNNAALTVVGCFNQNSDTPFFRPYRASISFGQNSAAPYEKQAKITFCFLENNDFPPKYGDKYLHNCLNDPIFTKLPAYVLESSKRFSDWSNFLDFKENLVKQKSKGLRYLSWTYNQDSGNLEFLIVSPDVSYLKQTIATMNRQNLHAFKLSVSTDSFIFSLPQPNGRDNERITASFADLGQLASKGLEIYEANNPNNNQQQIKDLIKELDVSGSKINFNQASFALLKIEPSEKLAYLISQIEFDPESQDYIDEFKEIFKTLPNQGFLAISLIGDLALISRHRRALNNLFSNENCYSPYLSSYLFNIKSAQVPESLEQVDHWFNEDLNENQKLAVLKMLSAPNIALVQGPPGTGKTTVIAEACLQFAERNHRILLASQSHDALDNALSRIKNHPQLRAIRLANDESRITDGGKAFTGAAVLAKQYTALKSFVGQKYLNRKTQLETGIDELNTWINETAFLIDDFSIIDKQIAAAQEQMAVNSQHLKTLEQEQRQERFLDLKLNEQSKIAQFLDQALNNCQNIINYQNVDLQLLLLEPQSSFNLVNLSLSDQPWFDHLATNFLELKSLKITINCSSEQFTLSKSTQEEEFLKLYSIVTNVNLAFANMVIDLKNLQLDSAATDSDKSDLLSKIKELDEQLAALKTELLQGQELSEVKIAQLQKLVSERNQLTLNSNSKSSDDKFRFDDYSLFTDYDELLSTQDKLKAQAWLTDHMQSIITFNERLLISLKQAQQSCLETMSNYQSQVNELKNNSTAIAQVNALIKSAKDHINDLQNQVALRLHCQVDSIIKLRQLLVKLAANTNKPYQSLTFKEQRELLAKLDLEPTTKQVLTDLTVQKDKLTNKSYCVLMSQNQTYELDLAMIQNLLVENRRFLEHLQQEVNQVCNQANGLVPLYEHWDKILSSPIKSALSDWELLNDTYLASCNLVAISCNENERTLNKNNFDGFDVVIIDEVSKATPLEMLLPLMRAPKAILVGDHRQLPPIFNEADGISLAESLDDDNDDDDTAVNQSNLLKYERMVTASLFKELFEQAPDILRQRLDIQFRMHPSIMSMINFFYNGELKCGNPELKREHKLNFTSPSGHVFLSPNDHVLWVDTYLDTQNQPYSIPTDRNINVVEAQLIARTLVDIDNQCESAGYGPYNKLKIGVVSFYQPQCRTIRQEIAKLLKRHNNWFQNIDVEINTVIRYQGKEKPVVILSLVKNNGKSPDQVLKKSKANIARFEFINVAMSRAQNLLIIFGATNMLKNREVFLPQMDSSAYQIKKVYKSMFDYLELTAKDGHMTTCAEFNHALSIPIINTAKASGKAKAKANGKANAKTSGKAKAKAKK